MTDHQPIFSYSGSELDALAGADNYYGMLIRRFGPHVGQRVLEVGAGVGTFAQHLLNHTEALELTLVEPADNNYPILRERFSAVPQVTTVHGFLEDLEVREKFDSIVAVNVLEHVEHDQNFLAAAWERLRPGGALLLFVPALPAIFGSLDRAFDHYRRYTKPALTTVLRRAEFEILDLRYTNLPGALAWFVSGKILRKKTIRPAEVQLYDRWMVPWISKLEQYSSPPFGQSLIAIAKRSSPPHTCTNNHIVQGGVWHA